jgi:hypothetical protein
MSGMKIFTLTVVVRMIALALHQVVTFGQTELDEKERLWLLVAGGLLLPLSARAASFDCSQAKRTLEVLICADPELSSLDGQMGEAYSAARSTVPKGSKQQLVLANVFGSELIRRCFKVLGKIGHTTDVGTLRMR